ncbi:efflux RND transporter periplasmic adaptor subunit [Neolewinella antarctica]|uniref:Multidrug efflux pump subunit AcrA (Membrane-fusion protein) n=1 Tax=Neolewinella antarctica TaxID=442734 RepID=A0ABX0X898_9BACT|nr:efflux RND transporter periplasmic adaptor subunit [Neolewinella antarctica]NJC25052.1 multidrug efflux pump subunit AcrA (membrane-fusion protein) [Neolewinella antarctica]
MSKKTPWYSTALKAVVGIMIILAGFFGMKQLGLLKGEAPKRDIPERIKVVEVKTINNGNLSTTLAIQGRLQAYNKIALFTEVGGAVRETGRPFKEGTYFKKGQTLLRIDDNEARFTLQSQKATLMNAVANMMPDLKIDYPESFAVWNDYLTNFDVDQTLPALPEARDQREKLFVAGRNLYSQFYSIKSLEDRLAKYTLTAPFSGVLTEAVVDQGAVVRPGQQLGEIMATGYYELVATVPLSELQFLETGGKVDLYSEDIAGRWSGTIRRISDQIDGGSQTVDVFIGVTGRELREGMYLRGEADARVFENVVEIDRNKLIDEEKVFVVENDTLLRQLPVTVRKFSRDRVIIAGLPDGAKLLDSEVAGPYDGMRVKLATAQESSETAAKPVTASEPVSK